MRPDKQAIAVALRRIADEIEAAEDRTRVDYVEEIPAGPGGVLLGTRTIKVRITTDPAIRERTYLDETLARWPAPAGGGGEGD